MKELVRGWVSRREPVVFENSKIPVLLSKLAPIEINAVSFACFVFCRGVLSKTSLRHETIHYHQQLELLFVGQWLLYGTFWLVGLVKHMSGRTAYYENPFEREAYDNQKKYTYLQKRPLWSWTRYIKG